MKRLSLLWIVAFCAVTFTPAKESFDTDVLGELRREGFEKSRVYETLVQLADVSGPRLTASPGIRRAQEWASNRLHSWGLTRVRLEPWGVPFPSWEVEACRVELVSPYYMPLIAYPVGWSPGLKEPVTSRLTPVVIKDEDDLARFRGNLNDAVILLGERADLGPSFQVDAERFTEDHLARLEQIEAAPADLEERRKRARERREWRRKVRDFIHQEGVALVLERGRGSRGTVFVGGMPANSDYPPSVALSSEDFGRLSRMIEAGTRPVVRVELRTKTSSRKTEALNLVAELQGSDPRLAHQVVMLGAHLDSWHAGTGASDNAAGCAVVMEAVRLLQSAGLRPRRTIRLVLWSGEEQGLLGSKAYVEQHFAPAEGPRTDEHLTVSAYYNLDNGAGRIRGIFMEKNEAVRPLFAEFIEPLADLGVTTLSPQATYATDHVSFDRAGLPGFQFIQDPLSYGTVTHHSNMDVVDQVLLDDLKQAAIVMAWFVYRTAMLEELIPRKQVEETLPAQSGVESMR